MMEPPNFAKELIGPLLGKEQQAVPTEISGNGG
jgi:hypothetical protein